MRFSCRVEARNLVWDEARPQKLVLEGPIQFSMRIKWKRRSKIKQKLPSQVAHLIPWGSLGG